MGMHMINAKQTESAVLKIFILLICTIIPNNAFSYNTEDDSTCIKVMQLNIWLGTSQVANGFTGLIDIIEKVNPDILILCELHNEIISSILNDKYTDSSLRITDALKKRNLTYYGRNDGSTVGVISKYKINDFKIIPTPKNNFMAKAIINIKGVNFAVYSLQLDNKYYGPYLPRGYSSTDWQKIAKPITNVQEITRQNNLSTRDETIGIFIEDAGIESEKENEIIMGGDFNEPSFQDWQENTKYLNDHNGVVMNWYCSTILKDYEFIDTFRAKYPNVVSNPGFTYPSANKDVTVGKLGYCSEKDERDRIDFIYYRASDKIELVDSQIVGPPFSVYCGQIDVNDSEDVIIAPKSVWPSDHNGNVTTLRLKQ